jgi:hypothetical protein
VKPGAFKLWVNWIQQMYTALNLYSPTAVEQLVEGLDPRVLGEVDAPRGFLVEARLEAQHPAGGVRRVDGAQVANLVVAVQLGTLKQNFGNQEIITFEDQRLMKPGAFKRYGSAGFNLYGMNRV